MRLKKQTQAQKIAQIGKVQFEMWVNLSKMSREIRVIQDRLGIDIDSVKKDVDEEE